MIMTIEGQRVDREFVKLLALQLQRGLMIVGLLVLLYLHPENTTAWALFGAAATDLFHSARNGNGNGKPGSH